MNDHNKFAFIFSGYLFIYLCSAKSQKKQSQGALRSFGKNNMHLNFKMISCHTVTVMNAHI